MYWDAFYDLVAGGTFLLAGQDFHLTTIMKALGNLLYYFLHAADDRRVKFIDLQDADFLQ